MNMPGRRGQRSQPVVFSVTDIREPGEETVASYVYLLYQTHLSPWLENDAYAGEDNSDEARVSQR